MKVMLKVSFTILSLCIILCLFTSSLKAGTTGKIAGKVIDGETGEALPGVNVIIEGTQLGSATDVEGDYFIINIPSGTYTVVASMMGYKKMLKTSVKVVVDRTIQVDFSLQLQVLDAGEEVVVTANREKIQLDVAQSQAVVEGEETIETIPTYGINAVFESQPGVSRGSIRGGGVDETLFMLDDQAIIDDRLNRPFIDINMSAVKEVQIQTGGFQAEYGNVRSGVINVITKEGGDRYSGSVNFRYSPAAYKHFGSSAFGEDTWEWKIWGRDESLQPVNYGGYEWEGWNDYVKNYKENTDDDLTNDISAEDALEVWRYHHREKDYKKPDHDLDLSFGGPIPGAKLPVIGGFLDKTSFIYSYRYQNNKFVFPSYRDGYYDNNSQLKLTHQLTPNLKITVSGLYGDTKSMGEVSPWLGGASNQGLLSKYYDSTTPVYNATRNSQMFKINHVLNPSTFYEVILSRFYSADSSRHTPNRNPFIIEDLDVNREGVCALF